MRECSAVLESAESTDEEKATATRRMLHEPFQALDEFLNPDEKEELDELKFKGPVRDATHSRGTSVPAHLFWQPPPHAPPHPVMAPGHGTRPHAAPTSPYHPTMI